MKPDINKQIFRAADRIKFFWVGLLLLTALMPWRMSQMLNTTPAQSVQERLELLKLGRLHPRGRGTLFGRDGTPLVQTEEYAAEKGGKRWKRVYRLGESGSWLLGMASPDLGATGVEAQIAYLNSEKPPTTWLTGDSVIATTPSPTCTLTIDPKLQRFAYDLLKNGGHKGIILFARRDTGDVLVATAYPAFDPNRRLHDSAYRRALIHAGIRDSENPLAIPFSPGSAVKPFIWHAYRQRFGTWPGVGESCPGGATVCGHFYPCHHHPVMPFPDWETPLAESCNTVATHAGARMTINDMMTIFGPTGFFDAQVDGFSTPLGSLNEDAGSGPIAVGAGVNVTPVGLLTAAGVLLGDGTRIPLRLIDSIDGHRAELLPRPRVLDPAVVAQEKSGLRAVVTRGTAYDALARQRLENAPLFGKTGTTSVSGCFWFGAPYPQSDVIGLVMLRGESGADAAVLAARLYAYYDQHGRSL